MSKPIQVFGSLNGLILRLIQIALLLDLFDGCISK